MGKPALVDIALMADALRDIGGILGIPSTVDVLLHLPDLVERVRGVAERAETVRVVTADRDVMRHELGRLQSMLALDAPYAVHDVLTRLADAAEHLHRDHDCDADGWEMTEAAAASARRIVAALVGYTPPDRDAETDARIADAVAAERHAIGAWLRAHPMVDGAAPFASAIEHGDHIEQDESITAEPAPPLPSLRLTLAANRMLLEKVETLTAERDRRIDPVEYAKAVMDGWSGWWVVNNGMPNNAQAVHRAWLESPERVTLLDRVGPDVLAEVER